jgi:hypothetical protein
MPARHSREQERHWGGRSAVQGEYLGAIQARLQQVKAERSLAPVLGPEAIEEARRLTEVLDSAGGDLQAWLSLGWLHYLRYQALPSDREERDLKAAVDMFTAFFIAGTDLRALPEPLRPMVATTTPSAALVPSVPVFTSAERLALTGFLAGYSGLTREAYELDLRQFSSWCQLHHLYLFEARRADIECFARDLEARGRARATITRRLCTIAGFYRYAVEEDLLDQSPAAHVRRPRLDYDSTPPGWTATNSGRCWSPPG